LKNKYQNTGGELGRFPLEVLLATLTPGNKTNEQKAGIILLNLPDINLPHYLVKIFFTPRGQKKVWGNT